MNALSSHPLDAPARPPAAASGSASSTGVFAGLRVALVGPVPPPAGGMANQTRQLAELLAAAGAQVDLVPVNPPYRPAWTAQWRGLRAGVRLLQHLHRLWRAAGRAQLLHVMANSGWSWHLFAAPAVWIGAWRGVPVLVNYRGGEADSFLARQAGWVRWTMRRAALLAVPSGFLEQVFARHGMSPRVLPNIVNLERFKPAPQLREPARHLVVARNLEAIYDNATAIRALALLRSRHPELRLTLAGTGPEERALRQLVGELGLGEAVRFAGRLERDDMAQLLRDADIVINPSLVDNMPNALLEAMAAGVPIVSTRAGGVPFMVDDGRTALLVAIGDAAAMAAALERLLGDTTLRQRLRDNGLAEVPRYSWPMVAPTLATYYRMALEAR